MEILLYCEVNLMRPLLVKPSQIHHWLNITEIVPFVTNLSTKISATFGGSFRLMTHVA